jgi:multiple sugar transport system substrate-binding protein
MPDGTEVAWDFNTVAEIAKLLTVDADGNDATSPDFDATSVVQWGYTDQYSDFRRTMTFLGGPGSLTGGPVDDPAAILGGAWNDPIHWIHDRMWLDHTMPNVEQVNSLALGGNPFASGNVAVAIAPLWYTCCITDASRQPVGGWDVAALPAGLHGIRTSPIHADVFGILASAKNPEAAFNVLTYLLGDEGSRELWNVAPARTADRAAWYAGMQETYPDAANLPAADEMIDYGDFTHQAPMPFRGQGMLLDFLRLLGGADGAEIDVDKEIDALQVLMAGLNEPTP